MRSGQNLLLLYLNISMNLNNRILINELISGLALKGAAAAKAEKIKTRPLASFMGGWSGEFMAGAKVESHILPL